MEFRTEQIREPIYVLGGYSVPDQSWVYKDKAGHEHRWNDDKLPTLEHIIEDNPNKYWCEDCYDYIDETIEYYECRECKEKIEPRYTRRNQPLMRHIDTIYYIDNIPVTKKDFMKKFKLRYNK